MNRVAIVILCILVSTTATDLYAQMATGTPGSGREQLDLFFKNAQKACEGAKRNPTEYGNCMSRQMCVQRGKSPAQCDEERARSRMATAACKGKSGNEFVYCQRCRWTSNPAQCEASLIANADQATADSSASDRTVANNDARISGAGVTPRPDYSASSPRNTGVDMTVLGVTLGAPLGLPSCPRNRSDPLNSNITSMCYVADGASVSIFAPRSRCPKWIVLCMLNGTLMNGQLVSVQMQTNGERDEKTVIELLREKYGPPSRTIPVTFQNTFGAKNSANELEWNLPGLHVYLGYELIGYPQGSLNLHNKIVIQTTAYRHNLKSRETTERAKQPRF